MNKGNVTAPPAALPQRPDPGGVDGHAPSSHPSQRGSPGTSLSVGNFQRSNVAGGESTAASSLQQSADVRPDSARKSVLGGPEAKPGQASVDSELSYSDTTHANSLGTTRPLDDWIPLSSQLSGWTPDKGDGRYSHIRERVHMPCLIENGLKSGESRIQLANYWGIVWFQVTRDFFISALNVPLWAMVPVLSVIYFFTFFLFSGIWAAVNAEKIILHLVLVVDVCIFIMIGLLFTQSEWVDKDCLYGITDYQSIWIFSMVTTQTIGYGNSGPNNCAAAAVVTWFQLMLSLIMNAAVVGIVFARVAFPQHRGRTIAISNSACILRRDGILKLLFRLMDMRETQVVSPTIKAFLYTWGDGRATAEGEYIPVRVEELNIGYIDGMMLLPITMEHTIDERSPLIGYTHDMLVEMRAEIVVTFEGTTEFGNPFMARQSYTALEIHWGSRFKQIIYPPAEGDTQYTVDIKRFHDVEPMEGLPKLLRGPLSEYVVASAVRTVPYPVLAENTLVLSDCMVLAPDENGDLALMFRVGDTYPLQHLNVTVKAAIYRWPRKKLGHFLTQGIPKVDFDMEFLDVGYDTGEDRLLLWLPTIVKHVINDDSPLRAWRTPEGLAKDASSTIAVEVEGYMYCNSQSRMRMRLYNVHGDVIKGHGFAPIVHVTPESVGTRPIINWQRFHDTVAISRLSDRVKERLPEYLQNDVHRLQQQQWRDIAKLAVTTKRRRIAPPELGSIALFPENDENNTFRLRAFAAASKLMTNSAAMEVGTPSISPVQRQGTMAGELRI